MPGATGYNVYRHAGTNAFDSATCTGAGGCLVGTITNGSTVSFTDSANALSAGAPAATEAQNYYTFQNYTGANAVTINGFGNVAFSQGLNVQGVTGAAGPTQGNLVVEQSSNT